MKTTLCFTLTLITFITLTFVPNSFAQDNSPEYIVRVIYFHPNDIEPQEDSVNTLKAMMKDIQTFFADEMERHGYGRKTFRLETDESENVMLHYMKGNFDHANYDQTIAVNEIRGRLDFSQKNIYLIWVDRYAPDEHRSSGGGIGSGETVRGSAWVFPLNFDSELYRGVWATITHEIGHAFGLQHDFRSDTYILSYGDVDRRSELSSCAAKWLDVHKYFNPNSSAVNDNTVVQMLPPSLAEPPATFRFKFEISDSDGLHQVMLYAHKGIGLIECKELSGKSSTVEFITDKFYSITTNNYGLLVMDRYGNFMNDHYEIDLSRLLPLPKVVSIPDSNLTAAIRKSGRGLPPNSNITQLNMLVLTKLIANNREINDLTGLEHATRLEELRLNSNNISNINSLAGLTKLNVLDLSDNQISDVSPLKGLVNLQELHIYGNPIKDKKPLLELLRKNPDVRIYLKSGREPLPVNLSHFRAEHTNAGVVLKWTTESEVDNAGFYIYRSKTKDGEFRVVNATMIQGAGTTGERNEYTWTDTTAKPNTVYYYRIEDVSHAGAREQLATVRLRGLVSARGKLTTIWADLKTVE